ncbi:MAG: hypothetical protein ACTHNB_00875 [Gaiellaceae bacterium]
MRTTFFVKSVLLACVVVVAGVMATTAGAGGGNSDAAKACQMGGWQTLVRQDGTGFTNTGDCVSYAAHGGSLIPTGHHLITFSEFPVGTVVTTQYASEGVLVSGTPGPFISEDGSNPTSPVLSPGAGFSGTIELEFVSPADGTTPASASSVSFDLGFMDTIGGATVTTYDIAGNQIASFATNQLGIEHITPTGAIHRITVVTTSDPAGAAIDNLGFSF